MQEHTGLKKLALFWDKIIFFDEYLYESYTNLTGKIIHVYGNMKS